MKLLTFQTDRFAWRPHERTWDDAHVTPSSGEVQDAVVAFLHVEIPDVSAPNTTRAIRKTLKHIKWVANKGELKTVVLHSFAHLGGDTAPASEAQNFLSTVADRLEATGYEVQMTPFGWFSAWDIDVRGHSMAKVWKAF